PASSSVVSRQAHGFPVSYWIVPSGTRALLPGFGFRPSAVSNTRLPSGDSALYSACTSLRSAWDRDLMIWRRPPASAAPLRRATSASRLDPGTATPAPTKSKSTPVAPIATGKLLRIDSPIDSERPTSTGEAADARVYN